MNILFFILGALTSYFLAPLLTALKNLILCKFDYHSTKIAMATEKMINDTPKKHPCGFGVSEPAIGFDMPDEDYDEEAFDE